MTKNKETNFSVLDSVIACLWKRNTFGSPELALEVIGGEWKGIIFSFSKFECMPQQMEGGFVPTRYETEIHKLPDHFPKDWEPTKEFDSYTSEVLFKWLSFINQNSMAPLIRAKTKGIQ